MKKILITALLFIAIGIQAQDKPKVKWQRVDSLVQVEDYMPIDTIDYDSTANKYQFYYSNWNDSITADTVYKIRYRLCENGIREKYTMKFTYKFDSVYYYNYYSKMKEKKDKQKDK